MSDQTACLIIILGHKFDVAHARLKQWPSNQPNTSSRSECLHHTAKGGRELSLFAEASKHKRFASSSRAANHQTSAEALRR